MFIDELTKSNEGMQKIIDACSSKSNVAVAMADNISKFRQLVEELDPSGINFASQGIFARKRAAAYWSKFDALAPGLDSLLNAIHNDGVSANNTSAMLKANLSRAEDALRSARERYGEMPPDADAAAQVIIAESYMSTVRNLLLEYDSLKIRADKIAKASAMVLRQAITLARISQRLGAEESEIYRSSYGRLKDSFI